MYTVTLFCKEKQEETVAFRFSHHSKGIYHDTNEFKPAVTPKTMLDKT